MIKEFNKNVKKKKIGAKPIKDYTPSTRNISSAQVMANHYSNVLSKEEKPKSIFSYREKRSNSDSSISYKHNSSLMDLSESFVRKNVAISVHELIDNEKF